MHYTYDLLVSLDVLTAFGYEDDKRLGFALDLLKQRRRRRRPRATQGRTPVILGDARIVFRLVLYSD